MRSNRPRHSRTSAALLAALAVAAGVAPTAQLHARAEALAGSGYSAPVVTEGGQVAVRYSEPYGSAANNAVASASRYSFVYNLVTAGAAHLSVPGRANLLAGNTLSLSPALKLGGEWYRAANSTRPARMTVHRAGPVMWEVEVQDITLANAAGEVLALHVDQTFWFWNEKVYVATRWSPQADLAGIELAQIETPLSPALTSYTTGTALSPVPADGAVDVGALPDDVTFVSPGDGALTYQVINKAGTDAVSVTSSGGAARVEQRTYDADAHAGATASWLYGYDHSTYTQLFVSDTATAEAGARDTEHELNPLSPAGFDVTDSRPWAGSELVGYDNVRGAYVVRVSAVPTVYEWRHPSLENAYPSVQLRIAAPEADGRTIRLATELPKEDVMAAGVTGGVSVLADEYQNPVGVPVQQSKKWDNTDTTRWDSFNETYSSFRLAPSIAEARIWHRTAFVKWGAKHAVGLPSLSLSNYGTYPQNPLTGQLWFEPNIGLSEAATYLLDDRSPNCTVCDWRAINGIPRATPTWYETSPNLDFLSFNGKVAKRWEDGLRWSSLGPNLSEFSFTLRQRTDEAPLQAEVTASMPPSDQGTRLYYRIRYRVLEDMAVADVSTQVRLLTLGARSTGRLPFEYLAADGTRRSVTSGARGAWSLAGEPLGDATPWFGFSDMRNHDPDLHNAGVIVRDVSGTLAGAPVTRLAVSLFNNKDGTAAAYLVPDTDATVLRAGDHIDVSLEASSWHPSLGIAPLVEQAENPVVVTAPPTATATTVIDDFVPRVRTADGQQAEFTLSGGTGYVPVSVEGFASPAQPLLEEYRDGAWHEFSQAVGSKDFWQVDAAHDDATFTVRYALPASSTAGAGDRRFRVRMVPPTAPVLPAQQPRPANAEPNIVELLLPPGSLYGPVVIDPINSTLRAVVRRHVDTTLLAPEFRLAPGASMTPPSGTPQSFLVPAVYTVVAENGFTTKAWRVTITKQR